MSITTGDPVGFRHEAGIHGSDEEFLAVVAPFLSEGIAAGEPTLLGVDARQQELVREALGDTTGLTLLDGQYAHPVVTLQLNYDLFADHVAAGAKRIRIVGEVPHHATVAMWDGWARYEAAINDIYASLPVWAICSYDTRTTAAHVLDDVERTHRYLATPSGTPRINPRYVDPATFLADRARTEIDPLERSRPHVELADPAPIDSRRAVAALARSTTLDPDTVDDLVYAVSEAVTNAIVHGRAPVELRAWAAPDRIVVAVRDQGTGPAEPYAGLLPGPGAALRGGLGLWIAHQLCSRVTLSHSADGYTVRLVGDTPHPAATA